jgi:hypothetical protein
VKQKRKAHKNLCSKIKQVERKIELVKETYNELEKQPKIEQLTEEKKAKEKTKEKVSTRIILNGSNLNV